MGLEFNLSVHGMRRTYNDMALAAGVNNLVTRGISGHLTERLQEEYTSVWAPLQRGAIDSVMSMMIGVPVDGSRRLTSPNSDWSAEDEWRRGADPHSWCFWMVLRSSTTSSGRTGQPNYPF